MKELIVSGYGVSIGTRRGLIYVKGRDFKQELSPADLDALVIVTGGVSISSRCIRVLMRHGVDIVFLDEKGRPLGRVYPPFVNKTVLTRRMQYEAYMGEKRWGIVGSLIEAKLRNQANLLKYYAKSRGFDYLKEVAYEITSFLSELPKALGDPIKVINLEAKAAHVYWSGIAMLLPEDLEFKGRNHDSPDPVNICLNYCYALLYGVCWRALVLAGLDPYAGYLHADRSGKESLVFDYSEMFKSPAIDRLLVKIFSEGWRPEIENGLLTTGTRGFLVKRFFEWLERKVRPTSGTPLTLSQAIKRWAVKLASYIRGDLKVYRGFVEPW